MLSDFFNFDFNNQTLYGCVIYLIILNTSIECIKDFSIEKRFPESTCPIISIFRLKFLDQ